MSEEWSTMAWERIKRIEAENQALRAQNKALKEAIDTLVAVVGLTAFKYAAQRAILQEAVDGALKALGRERK